MPKIAILCLVSVFFMVSCNEGYTPKPPGYPRIERQEVELLKFEHRGFSFLYPADAQIEEVKTEAKRGFWFNISYPAYNAIVYCSYIPVDKNSLPEALEDSYQLAYSHASKADGIDQTQFVDSLHHTSGIIYNIKGSVAVPLQFYVTDNTSNFLRGSLYFDQKIKTDSVSPVINFLREDIRNIMESIEWNNSGIK